MLYFLTLAWSNRQLNKQPFYYSLRFSCICLLKGKVATDAYIGVKLVTKNPSLIINSYIIHLTKECWNKCNLIIQEVKIEIKHPW